MHFIKETFNVDNFICAAFSNLLGYRENIIGALPIYKNLLLKACEENNTVLQLCKCYATYHSNKTRVRCMTLRRIIWIVNKNLISIKGNSKICLDQVDQRMYH